jgi:hypothetical protein
VRDIDESTLNREQMTFRVAAWQEISELDGPSGLGAIRKDEDLTNEAAGRPF